MAIKDILKKAESYTYYPYSIGLWRSQVVLPMRSVVCSGGGSGCSEDNEGHDSHNLRSRYHRHTPEQIQRLEEFYRESAHPDEKERRQLGLELGLELKQIKFWFQNKRTQMKTQNKRADNDALRSENDIIRSENIVLEETMKYLVCESCGPCGGAPVTEEDKNQNLLNLEQENIKLKSEHDRLSAIVTQHMGRPQPGPELNTPDTVTAGQGSGNPAFELDDINPGNLGLADQMKANTELEKLHMMEIAARAMNELITLLSVNQPLWIKSPTEEQYFLDYDIYCNIFAKTTELKYNNSKMESSKDSGVVHMDARSLVDLYLDPDKWVDLFPTVISNAWTMRVLKAGSLDTRSDSLQLIHEQKHVLSPLMRQRKFFLLRHCQQIKPGTWVIVDVSCNSIRGASNVLPNCWKYPSGCMIEAMPDGLSRVTCVERVEVDDSFLVHPVYEDLVKSTLAFGAKRWISTLQRACERFSFLKEAGRVDGETGRGRRGMIVLASKMIKGYCSIFSYFETTDFNQLSELTKNKVQIAVRKSTCSDEPVGLVIQAASSFWVPASPERVFSCLNDHLMRSQWDILCNGGPVSLVTRTPTGYNPSNAISILQPDNVYADFMILQETAVGPLGSFIIYAPVDSTSMLELRAGIGPSQVSILPSGFVITPDGPDKRAEPSTSTAQPRSSGSVITAAFQILACSSLSTQDVSTKLIESTKSYATRVVCVMKAAFSESD